ASFDGADTITVTIGASTANARTIYLQFYNKAANIWENALFTTIPQASAFQWYTITFTFISHHPTASECNGGSNNCMFFIALDTANYAEVVPHQTKYITISGSLTPSPSPASSYYDSIIVNSFIPRT